MWTAGFKNNRKIVTAAEDRAGCRVMVGDLHSAGSK